MNPTTLLALDWFFFLAHFALIAVNLFGWVWRRLRPAVLVTQVLTWSSWLVLGLWYGLGYCPLTDWHWQVKRLRGEETLPVSLIKYYLDLMTGGDSAPFWIDVVTVSAFIAATLLNGALLARDAQRSRRASPPAPR